MKALVIFLMLAGVDSYVLVLEYRLGDEMVGRLSRFAQSAEQCQAEADQLNSLPPIANGEAVITRRALCVEEKQYEQFIHSKHGDT